MTRRRPTAAEKALLPGRILECLQRNSVSTARALALELGFSNTAILSYLRSLEAKNLAFRFEPVTDNYMSVVQFWKLGAMPPEFQALPRSLRSGLPMVDVAPEEKDPLCHVRQQTVKTWAPLHIRGEIETYLFGPAHREAA